MEMWRLKRPEWRWLPSADATVRFLLVYVIILIAAKFGQYLFFSWDTSPAVLWPPTGIAVAVMWLYSYRYAVPIFLGLLVSSLTGPNAHQFPQVFFTPATQVLAQLVGVYLLHRLRFEGAFADIRNVLVFFASIAILAIISPILTTTLAYFMGTLDESYLTVFSRRWAGYAFSCLILTPFIIAWTMDNYDEYRTTILESITAGIMLSSATYFLFWTRLPAQYGFLFFAFFFIAVVWICLRFPSRVVTLTVVTITFVGILGLFLSPSPDQALNEQVFAAELFLFIVVPLMYAYSAVVKERERNMQRLKLALAEIEMENANKTNFIAVLAHELRNPLAPIKTTLEIMKLQKLQPDIHQLVVNANTQLHTMRRLLDDLLDVTRVTRGKFVLKKEVVPFIPLLTNVTEVTKAIVSERGHQLAVRARTGEEIFINVDPVRFEQVLVNIINNAAKFTEPGGVIELSYSIKNGNIEIRIKDTGKGIEVENLERIFRSFWQIYDGNEQPTSGIGVGLALARQIIELHDGTIRAESPGLGKGSTFVITIPRMKAPAKVEQPAQPAPSIVRTYKIFIVDDNKMAADTLAKLLTLKGHQVTTAYSGGGALDSFNASAHEIILLDIGLGDMSGYDVAKAMRANGFGGSLIALSGYGQQEDKKKAFAAGFDHHFTKPMSVESFESYIQTWQKPTLFPSAEQNEA